MSPIAVLIVLAAAYRTGDLSLAYPVARALPVLLVPVVTAFLGIGEPVSPLGAAGMVTVVVGLLLVVHRSFATVGLSSFFFRPRGRARVRADFAALDKRLTMLAGVGIVVAYGLVLVAFGFAENVSYVVAFRQVSLPIGTLFGVVFPGERVGVPRLVGTLLIVAGLALVATG